MKIEIKFEFEGDQVLPAKVRQSLSQPDMLDSLEQAIDHIQRELHDVICAEHQQPPLITVVGSLDGKLQLDISGCCEALVKEAKARFKGELNQTAYFRPNLKLVIQIETSRRPLVFDFQSIDTLVIGRSDPDTGEEPDIDLSDFGAQKKGISRRHATIFWQNGALHIMDEGSANGTSLNGDKLEPHRPYMLRSGDMVGLATLTLRLWLE
ncbi:MAG: FHA domain-containing protein [Anaerolineae bacterium]|nr:FHA domain-containing protein [Anaerolineae bacterium]